MERKDLLIAPAGEAALILIVGLAGYLAREPLIFASLGPTAYELIETPHRRSARPYSIFVGHLIGVGVGYMAISLTGAWHVPVVSSNGVPLIRVWTAVLAAGLTVFGTLLLRAGQPAAIATTLLISLGMMQRPRDAAILMGAVVLMIVAGEPLRKLRLQTQERRREREAAKHMESHS